MTFRGTPFLRSAASMVAATALASLALPTTQASAVATGVHVRYDFGDHQNILEITGTDGDDEIFVEDGVGGVAVSIPFGTWLALDDSTGTCIRTMDNAVACPNTLELLDVTLGGGKDKLSWFLTPSGLASLWMGQGRDYVRLYSGVGSPILVHGEAGKDVLIANGDAQQSTSFWGGRGADLSWGPNQAWGGAGDDRLRAGPEGTSSSFFGGAGADVLIGRSLDDDLRGGLGPDQIRDNGGDDVIYGGPGSDVIDSNDGGHDDVNCGPGRDHVNRDWRDVLHLCEVVS